MKILIVYAIDLEELVKLYYSFYKASFPNGFGNETKWTRHN